MCPTTRSERERWAGGAAAGSWWPGAPALCMPSLHLSQQNLQQLQRLTAPEDGRAQQTCGPPHQPRLRTADASDPSARVCWQLRPGARLCLHGNAALASAHCQPRGLHGPQRARNGCRRCGSGRRCAQTCRPTTPPPRRRRRRRLPLAGCLGAAWRRRVQARWPTSTTLSSAPCPWSSRSSSRRPSRRAPPRRHQHRRRRRRRPGPGLPRCSSRCPNGHPDMTSRPLCLCLRDGTSPPSRPSPTSPVRGWAGGLGAPGRRSLVARERSLRPCMQRQRRPSPRPQLPSLMPCCLPPYRLPPRAVAVLGVLLLLAVLLLKMRTGRRRRREAVSC